MLNAPWKWEFDKPSCYLTPGVDAKALTRSVQGGWANSPLLMKKDSCWQKKGSGKCSHSSRRERAPQRTLSKEQHLLSDLVTQPELPYALEKARFQHVLSYVSKREYFLLDLFLAPSHSDRPISGLRLPVWVRNASSKLCTLSKVYENNKDSVKARNKKQMTAPRM